ncbi:quinone oxidoreductase [Paracoccus aurantiacus]|uniref:Quinone oxidoreductase n=1 Tax=Paracoccus aurantiacus TaxID=2599412 RepID=A0A5C6RWV3_9RHOB|nr:quinone oxidoreductase [Paracoccus aurantiacus]TXB66465.1 quinone oxidoreductase [Paracoccus aurantiacus]
MPQINRVEIDSAGPPEVMRIVAGELPPPGPGEVRIRHTAIGFNYIDVYQRSGTYPLTFPSGLGFEAAGVVEAVGDGVTDISIGDRVAYMNAGTGAYADARNVSADRLVHLPDQISDEAAASLLFKGLTAQYLLRAAFAAKPGDLILVHAAAGGVGQIMTRWATAMGVDVIGTTGSPTKTAAILDAGAIGAIDTGADDWPEAFLRATGWRKAQAIYDSVGKATLLKSLDCAAPFGTVVSFGSASGAPPAIDTALLRAKGELYLTATSVFPRNADPKALQANAADLFDAIARGHVAVDIGARFPLSDIVDVHRAAEGRNITGAIIITP